MYTPIPHAINVYFNHIISRLRPFSLNGEVHRHFRWIFSEPSCDHCQFSFTQRDMADEHCLRDTSVSFPFRDKCMTYSANYQNIQGCVPSRSYSFSFNFAPHDPESAPDVCQIDYVRTWVTFNPAFSGKMDLNGLILKEAYLEYSW